MFWSSVVGFILFESVCRQCFGLVHYFPRQWYTREWIVKLVKLGTSVMSLLLDGLIVKWQSEDRQSGCGNAELGSISL